MTILSFSGRKTSSAREINRGVQTYAREHGWNVMLIESSLSSADLREMIDFWSPDGCLVSRMDEGGRILPSAFGRIPSIAIDRWGITGRNDFCIHCDNVLTARIAARGLLADASPSYVYVEPVGGARWSDERKTEFARLVRMNGKTPTVIRSNGASDLTYVRRIAERLERLERPIGVFAANDATAETVLAACQYARLSVPDDVAVVGVDNDPDICEYTKPTLSSISIDFHAAGYLAAQALAQLMANGRAKPENLSYPPIRLVSRESTRRLPKADAGVREALEFIRKQIADVSAAKVAALFPCSRRMAEIRFRAATGRSILQEIRSARLSRAYELLARGNLQMKAIANFCGYRSSAAFAKFFRSASGISPRHAQRHQPSDPPAGHIEPTSPSCSASRI